MTRGGEEGRKGGRGRWVWQGWDVKKKREEGDADGVERTFWEEWKRKGGKDEDAEGERRGLMRRGEGV